MVFDYYDGNFANMIRTARRILIGFFGFALLIIGVAMIVLPGPAIIIIPAAIVILASEFVWAKNIIKRIRYLFPDHVLRRWFRW